MPIKKEIKSFSIEGVKQMTSGHVLSVGDDLVVIDDFTRLDLQNTTWQLKFLAYCFCTSGHVVFNVNAKNVEMKAGDLFISSGELNFTKTSISSDFAGRMILVSQELVQDSIAGLTQLWPFLLFICENPVVHLQEWEKQWLSASYDYTVKRLSIPGHHYLRETITSLIRLFYFDICDLLSRHCDTSFVTARVGGYSIFDRFIRLARQNFRRERSVTWYSNELCLTPKYLSEVVKSVSGKTAGEWITNFVILEIKQLLTSTPLSVKEIASQLNFANQSFIGKYFKNATGISPLEYRRQATE